MSAQKLTNSDPLHAKNFIHCSIASQIDHNYFLNIHLKKAPYNPFSFKNTDFFQQNLPQIC